jgi:hypothetical protein
MVGSINKVCWSLVSSVRSSLSNVQHAFSVSASQHGEGNTHTGC